MSKAKFPLHIKTVAPTEDLSKFNNEAEYFWNVLAQMGCEKQNEVSYWIIVTKMRAYREYRKHIEALIDKDGL